VTSTVAVEAAAKASRRSHRIASHAVVASPAAIAASIPLQASGQCRAVTPDGRLTAR
jgi:hypothetical protein